jgi:DNA-binding transcriptional LysR family regulator
MEFRQLEYFAAVARDGTYTAAAERLHVAQPALWKQVHELQRELGVALFERVGRRVRITSAGLLVLDRAEQILLGSQRLHVLANDLRLARIGRVRIGCFAPHIAAFLAPVIAAFRRDHPNIAVELVEHGLPGAPPDTTSLVELLRAGALDLITTSRVEDDNDLEGFRAYEVCVVVVSPPAGDRAKSTAGRARRPISSLRDIPLLVSPQGYYSRGRLEAACRSVGFEPRIEVESTSPSALLALAEHGVGTAVLADDAVAGQRRAVLTVDRKPMSDAVWLYRQSAQDPAVGAFFAAARAAARRSPRG